MLTIKTTEPLTATVHAFGQSLIGEFGEDALRVGYTLHTLQFSGDHTKVCRVAGLQQPIRFRVYMPMNRRNRVQVGWSWAGLVERKPMMVDPRELLGRWNRGWEFVSADAHDVSADFQFSGDSCGVGKADTLTIECRAIVERIEHISPASHRYGTMGGKVQVAVDMASIGDVVRRFTEYR